MNTPQTGHVESLIAEAMAINPATAIIDTQKKIEDGETVLGCLSPTMQKIWILREQRRVSLLEIGHLLDDEMVSHGVEHESGKQPRLTDCREHRARLEALVARTQKPKWEFNVINPIFDLLLSLDFSGHPEGTILGVREGFQVICRGNNLRMDRIVGYVLLTRNLGACGQ